MGNNPTKAWPGSYDWLITNNTNQSITGCHFVEAYDNGLTQKGCTNCSCLSINPSQSVAYTVGNYATIGFIFNNTNNLPSDFNQYSNKIVMPDLTNQPPGTWTVSNVPYAGGGIVDINPKNGNFEVIMENQSDQPVGTLQTYFNDYYNNVETVFQWIAWVFEQIGYAIAKKYDPNLPAPPLGPPTGSNEINENYTPLFQQVAPIERINPNAFYIFIAIFSVLLLLFIIYVIIYLFKFR